MQPGVNLELNFNIVSAQLNPFTTEYLIPDEEKTCESFSYSNMDIINIFEEISNTSINNNEFLRVTNNKYLSIATLDPHKEIVGYKVSLLIEKIFYASKNQETRVLLVDALRKNMTEMQQKYLQDLLKFEVKAGPKPELVNAIEEFELNLRETMNGGGKPVEAREVKYLIGKHWQLTLNIGQELENIRKNLARQWLQVNSELQRIMEGIAEEKQKKKRLGAELEELKKPSSSGKVSDDFSQQHDNLCVRIYETRRKKQKYQQQMTLYRNKKEEVEALLNKLTEEEQYFYFSACHDRSS